MAAPALQDYEYQLSDTGVLLNAAAAGSQAVLPFIDVTKIEGLDSATIRLVTTEHTGVDGQHADAQFYSSRTIVIEGMLYADPSDPETVYDQLKVDFGPTAKAKPFYFKTPNKAMRVAFGKGIGAKMDIDAIRRVGQTALQLQILCDDPLLYDAQSIIGSGSLGVQNTGFSFNLGFNFGFGGAVVPANGAVLFNAGNHTAYPVITIYGSISNPVIVDAASGRSIALNISLGNQDYLTVDTATHTVVLNGTANRRNVVLGIPQWFGVEPTSGTTIVVNGSASIGTGSITAINNSADIFTIQGTDADASDVSVGGVGRLYDSTGAVKEATLFTVTAKSSVSGTTTVTFTPGASAMPVIGDMLRIGGSIFTVSMRNTWY